MLIMVQVFNKIREVFSFSLPILKVLSRRSVYGRMQCTFSFNTIPVMQSSLHLGSGWQSVTTFGLGDRLVS